MKCVICGKEIERSFYADAIICSGRCFNKHFWNKTLDDAAIIINGACYHDAEPENCSVFLGHGGQHFSIEMFDGRVIETNNLWYNGEVPTELNIKDNARFIK